MKRKIICTFFSAILMVISIVGIGDSEGSMSEMDKDSYNEFVRNICYEMIHSTEGDNLLLSPLSTFLCLGILSEFTKGETQNQILNALKVDDLSELHEEVIHLISNSTTKDAGSRTSIASSIWMPVEDSLKVDTVDILRRIYKADIYQGDMGSKEMNAKYIGWMNDQTYGILSEQLQDITLPAEDAFSICSTMYSSVAWQEPFDPVFTKEDVFYSENTDSTCSFMFCSERGYVYEEERFTATYKLLKNGMYMVFFLPKTEVSVENLAVDEGMYQILFQPDIWTDMETVMVNLTVPKFDCVSELNMKEIVQSMGVVNLLEKNLLELVEGVQIRQGISKLAQINRMHVDEEGIETAAITGIMDIGSMMDEIKEVDFTLNRPFLYAVTTSDGEVLNLGVFQNPLSNY